MMTCRLLCALLVLALCCCPSVCATDAQPKVDVESSSQTTTTNKTQLPDTKEMSAPKNNVGVVQPPSPLDPSQGTAGHSDTSTTGFVAKPGNDGGEGPGSSSTGTNPNGVSNTLQADGNKGTKGSSSHKRLSEEQANSESEDSTEETTTTTTTRQPQLRPPPLAPEAPGTTTSTEAPTTTTTHAPSRLREIDGSLSSSAWLCAPLLLAVSALAYNTVD
ncbi:putative mucin TcMUCII [Trypanosoma cruzi]|uniref:Putative mucin TcMUCII n=1 Tax=Trypanosoma cruzi TaxID=5693 RepID=A0A2V2UVH9_TRYCR|nr:putative mucin TcMUCII [Trypanosoma cruzi]